MSEEEIWLPVFGHEGHYEVSSLGNVRSLPGILVRKNGKRFTRKGQPLNPSKNNKGYLVVGISGKARFVHLLVIESFIGPRPGGMECCHNNGNPLDCRISNLRWGTPQENQGDKVIHGTSNRGERCGHSKLKESQVLEILSSKRSNSECALRFGVTRRAIGLIRNRINWKYLGVQLDCTLCSGEVC